MDMRVNILLINGQLQPHRSQADPHLIWCVPTEIVCFEW